MFEALTGLGLSAAAGLNAAIPLLAVSLFARFTDLITLPQQYEWLESWWAIGIGCVLLITEVVFDKVPVVDHLNDTVGTVLRPIVGGVVFSATTAAKELDNSSWLADKPWLSVLAGVVVSFAVHGTKAAARPVINASTLGFGAPVVSTVEDGTSIGLSIAAVMLPLLVIAGLAILLWVGIWLIVKVRRRGGAGRWPGSDRETRTSAGAGGGDW